VFAGEGWRAGRGEAWRSIGGAVPVRG
jgi:hypothetical protein